MNLFQVVFSSGIEAGGTKRVATSIPLVSFSPDVLHQRLVQAVDLLVESLFFYSQPYLQTKYMFYFMFSHARARLFSGEIAENRNKDSLRASGQLEQASVKNIRAETKYRDGCRDPFCIFCINPALKYYLDQAHITV